jgi:PAS domain S-box-containing protein
MTEEASRAMPDDGRPEAKSVSWDFSNPVEIHRVLFEEATDGMFINDANGTFIAANPRGMELTGYGPRELIGMTIRDLAPPGEHAGGPIRWDLLRQGKIVTHERCILRQDGRMLPVEISARMLPDGNLLSIVRDISQRKQAESELRARNNQLGSIFRVAPIGIGVVRERVLLAVNDRICQMTGYTAAELIGESARVLYPNDEEFSYVGREKYRQIGHHGTGTVETRWRCKDGRIIDVLLSSTPIDAAELNAGVTFTALDITARKRAEREKDQLQAQLLQAQKMESVGRLAGGLAHDFNNMLTAILGHAQLAMMQCPPTEPIQEDLQVIVTTVHRSADLIRQLLTFARKQPAAPKILNLNDTMAGMLSMLRRLIGEDINFLCIPGADLWSIRMDPSQINQLLVNLCVNARDAIDGVGRIRIETCNCTVGEGDCTVHADCSPGEYVVLSVSDDGCGMSREVLDHLFEPFFTTKEVGKGTGLGMATVYGIVKQNGGCIAVTSQPGCGTCIQVFLPRVMGEAAVVASGASEAISLGQGETVLLVEDEETILAVGREMLSRLGYTVLTARSPAEAIPLAAAHAGKIRLLITDVIMPGMNGRELAQRLKADMPELGCLYISGYTANVIAHHGFLDAGVHLLQKPFSFQDLALKVREALARA